MNVFLSNVGNLGIPLMWSPVRPHQRCAVSGVQDPTPVGVSVFQQKPEQDQEWIFWLDQDPEQDQEWFLITVFFRSFVYLHSTQFVTEIKQEQESINFV